MEQSRNKKFFKDIIIYAFGSVCAKLITFLLFALFTFFITPDDIGYYDLALATSFLFMAIISLQLREGVFRFIIDCNDESYRKAVIGNSYRMISITMAITLLLYVTISSFIEIRCGPYIFGLLLTMSFYEVQIQVIRGLGHTKTFVVCGILTALLILLLSIIFVVILKWNIEGIFLANIIARLLTLCIIEAKIPVIRKYFSLKNYDKNVVRDLLKYCCPLILSVSLLWAIGNSYRYFIAYYMDLYSNGLFAAAFKLAAIIEILAMIIFQAWQETSVRQLNAKDRDKYYSSVLNSYLLALAGLVITLSFFLKVFYSKIVDTEYENGVIYIYALCVSQIWYALQIFMSAIFHAKKNTMQVMYVTLLSFVVSLVVNSFFIKHVGLMGAAIAYGLSYFFMFVCYMIAVQKIARVRFSIRTVAVSTILLSGGGFIYYNTENVSWSIAYWIASMTAIYFTLPKSIVQSAGEWITDKCSSLKK